MKKLFVKNNDYVLSDKTELDGYSVATIAESNHIFKSILDIIKQCETYLADKENKDNPCYSDVLNSLGEFYDIRDYLIANILGLEDNEIELE